MSISLLNIYATFTKRHIRVKNKMHNTCNIEMYLKLLVTQKDSKCFNFQFLSDFIKRKLLKFL